MSSIKVISLEEGEELKRLYAELPGAGIQSLVGTP